MCTNITYDESKRIITMKKKKCITKMLIFESMCDVYFGNQTSARNTQNFGQ